MFAFTSKETRLRGNHDPNLARLGPEAALFRKLRKAYRHLVNTAAIAELQTSVYA